AQLLHRRKSLNHNLGEIGLRRCGGAEAGAPVGGFDDGLNYRGRAMAQYQWPPGEYIIDVAVAVGVGHARAAAADDDRWFAADGAECADRRVDAAGEESLGTLLQR